RRVLRIGLEPQRQVRAVLARERIDEIEPRPARRREPARVVERLVARELALLLGDLEALRREHRRICGVVPRVVDVRMASAFFVTACGLAGPFTRAMTPTP